MSKDNQAIPVTQLVRRMRNALEITVGELWVEGEVSNLRRQSSGHYYFTLKDARAQISCAMFGAKRNPGSALLQDGAKVQVFAEVTLYEARGQAQMVIKQVKAIGQGDLQAKFDALKAKLHTEGLFDSQTKQPLPYFPTRIGIVTSPTGAALQDMLNVLNRRAPWLEVVLYPTQVQGAGAEIGIVRGIEHLGNDSSIDTIIICRGGGSLEDLWNFNEECVARAIANCPTPLISAVGHEIDFTISDFAADVRAPTPSAAAELVAPSRSELLNQCNSLADNLSNKVQQRIQRLKESLAHVQLFVFERDRSRFLRDAQQRLDSAENDLTASVKSFIDLQKHKLADLDMQHRAAHPAHTVSRASDHLTHLETTLDLQLQQLLQQKKQKLKNLSSLLNALGPNAVLSRGYSISRKVDGSLIRNTDDVAEGEEMITVLANGSISSVVRDSQKKGAEK